MALIRDYRILANEAILNVRSDKRKHPPHGLFGGQDGSPSWNIVNPGQGQRILPSLMTEVETLNRGDLYRHIMAGGGGFGNPFERKPEKVLQDVIEEKVSPERARIDYGVAIAMTSAGPVVDLEGTTALRGGAALHPGGSSHLPGSAT
jgi:N-methylhydantoinase B